MSYITEPDLLYGLFFFLVFGLGICIASFLNVLIYRWPRKLDYIRGNSFCPDCRHILAVRDLMPLISYCCLRGHCRYCGKAISPCYPLVELLGGILALFALLIYGPNLTALAVFALIAGLIPVAFIDFYTLEIPNGLVLYLLIPAIALIFLLPGPTFWSHGLGLIAISLPLILITGLIPGAFGGGDIKLMAVGGLALGWQLSLLAIFLSFLTGGIFGIYLIIFKHAQRKQPIAFGPFLAIGITTALLVGNTMIQWYVGLFY